MFKKRVVFKKGVPANFFLVVALVIFVVLAYMLRENWTYVAVIAVLGALFFRRYFCGKLRLQASDLVLFWGLPGSGKTLFLTKTAKDNHESWYIGVNEEYEHLKLKDFVYGRSDMAKYSFPHSALFFDEASLNGFDNRDFKTNFKVPGMLETFKKHRQMDLPIVFSNQGFEECDIKIRQSLANKTYFVENMGLWCRASLMIRDVTISEIDGQPQEGYRFPTVLERLFDPSMVLYAIPEYFGRYYSTKNPPVREIFAPLIHAYGNRKLARAVSWDGSKAQLDAAWAQLNAPAPVIEEPDSPLPNESCDLLPIFA